MIYKYSIKGITKHKFFTITLLLELMCIFISLYNIIFYSNKVNQLYKQINSFSKNKTINRFFYDQDINETEFTTIKDDYSLFKKLDYDKKFSYIISTPYTINIDIFNNCKDFLDKDYDYHSEDKSIYVKSMLVNYHTLKDFKTALSNGRLFNRSDFYDTDSSVLPVILGYDYRNIYKVGDSFIYYGDGGCKYEAKVIGILKKEQNVPLKFDTENAENAANVSSNYVSLDDRIIIPINSNIDMDIGTYYNLFYYNFVLIDNSKSNNQKRGILEGIKNDMEKFSKVKFCEKSYDYEVTAEVNKYKEIKEKYEITFGIAFIFATITIAISIINIINNRKLEFGIYLFNGGTIKDIIRILFAQMIGLVILGSIISCILIEIYYKFFQIDSFYLQYYDVQINTLNFKIIAILLIFEIFYVAAVSAIPISNFKKYSISDLLRRDE